ncbi:hypothetical protein FGM00_19240 [Aggregatimonas sangjinii]|uniref:DUF3575 domain-containing protein n=1 Tax=Aggregatimonas sangjinii TaxID=2583587 RepID=A0A5B7STP6_9FLAO|nr:hypothetical protein [Aggregatimonas sangjinii]QCX02145.1 hypothetical protein FGM00_19240 [Aggregatimonas sangjinii]
MKKILLLLLSLSTLGVAAQAYPSLDNPHEIKLNLGLFLATGSVEGSYEYFFSEDISIGGTLYVDSKPTDFNGGFGIGPNLRAYFFGFSPRGGFFAEVFGLYYTGEDEVDENELLERDIDYSTAALGLGGGHKWVTRSDRFTLEFHAGIGRNFNTPDFRSAFMYRGGLSVGYRF